jgi:hypothetical protein
MAAISSCSGPPKRSSAVTWGDTFRVRPCTGSWQTRRGSHILVDNERSGEPRIKHWSLPGVTDRG